ncbi:MAG: hypothetical protein OEV55_02075 [candidate division Zixibacteria bacterium]|nr:hypothetical protein [candidate division Zixibacteria bacterium]
MIKKLSLICLFLTVSLGFYNNGHSQPPSEYALIPVPVQENPEIWKMTKSEALQAFETQLFINPLSASQSYIMDASYNLYSGMLFELDHGWNRIIFSECLDDWIAGYGTLGSGTTQFRWPRRLDCEGLCNATYGITPYYYIFVADASNNRIVKLRYRYDTQVLENLGVITGDGLTLPLDLDLNNGFEFYWTYNDYLWILNGNSQIKRYDLFEDTFKCTYGSYGSGEGQFRHPTAIVSGRNPFIVNGDKYANNDHFYVADRGNNRLVWLIKTYGGESIYWYKEIYLDLDIVDLEVDNFGQV